MSDGGFVQGSPVGRLQEGRWLGYLPGVSVSYLENANPLRADQLEDIDALILLAHRFDAGSVPASGRLAVVARFGVGYDTVDVEACTSAGIALVITPDGVRRPVAVSIITLMLALMGKLMVKDRLTREAGPGFAKVEGSDTCVRVGGSVRAEYGATFGHGGSGATSWGR